MIIDRFDSDYAVCEKADGTMVIIGRSSLPAEACEGDVISEDAGGILFVDTEKTNARRERLKNLRKRLISKHTDTEPL